MVVKNTIHHMGSTAPFFFSFQKKRKGGREGGIMGEREGKEEGRLHKG